MRDPEGKREKHQNPNVKEGCFHDGGTNVR
jgi:hypothetical protein